MASSEQKSLAMAASFLNGSAVLLEPGGVIQEMGAGLDLHGHVRQLEADPLEAPDGPAELFPDTGVPQRLLVGAFGDPERERGDADAAGVEGLEEVDEPVARRCPARSPWAPSASSKISSRVSLARQPILSSFFPARTPWSWAGPPRGRRPAARHCSRSTVSLVTMKLVIPLLPLSRLGPRGNTRRSRPRRRG